ncbi:hypothetical protein D8Y22_12035 [Salinadaptatus halalkaliphilus]|uniref:Uncharacterized protein n=1 Tax=Salinadaptatus halalkaliphilus TaxID=2419781 RepID=A0A4S3TKA9_9EURY|nr:hypothetical protein [Salinadaptatus halalkaliphilus]THE64552.1 hypothetical protein D8Y22_12035 [Salinadaptatus halalkaliphilus]
MQQCPRRSLLGGLAATASLVAVGTTSADESDDATRTGDADAASNAVAIDAELEALPAAVAGESTTVSHIDYDRWLEADHPHDPRPTRMAFGVDADAIETMTTAYSVDEDFASTVVVLTGDVDLEGDPTSRTVAGVDYDRHEAPDEDELAAVVDDIVVVADDAGTIEHAVAASAGEGEQLLETDSRFETAFEQFAGADNVTVTITDDDDHVVPGTDDATVAYTVRAMTVLDADTIETVVAFAFDDDGEVTDDIVEAVEGELAYMATSDEPTVEVDGSLVTATAERDLAAERAAREHDSPGSLRADRDIDPDDEYLEIEIGRGDPTPIEDLTLELDDEVYDRDIWADGHGTLEAGDTIVVDMDDVEPNLSIMLRHDHAAGGSGSGTTILNNLTFEFDYDHDDDSLAVTYGDEFPLEGDHITLAAYDERPFVGRSEDEPEPHATADPWTGQTVTDGDAGALEDVSPGDHVVVGWQGRTHRDAIGSYRVSPPGDVEFEYEYDDRQLSATLSLEDERPADAYELRIDDDPNGARWDDEIDGDPAETQWSDETDTLSGETTIDVTDVSVGVTVDVVWVADDARVASTRALPSVHLEYDDGAIEHVGGDELPVSTLEVRVWGDDGDSEFALEDELSGEFEAGDRFDVDVDDFRHATLVYGDDHSVGFVAPDR